MTPKPQTANRRNAAAHAPLHWHHYHIDEVLRLLEVDLAKGLSDAEVKRRQAKFGTNRVSARRGTPVWRKFLLQFNQPLVYILLLAGTVTALLGEWVDSTVIAGVVLVNAVIGFLQEAKAEKAIEALAKMVAVESTVRRNGEKQRVRSAELVPGDVVLLQSGDRVPADLRLVQVRNLQVDESALTGESLPVAKHPDPVPQSTILAERKNLAYAGTYVTSGQAESVVWAIGDETETGRIAWLISNAVELTTPLTRKIAEFSKWVLWVIVVLATVTFLLGVARGAKPADMFMAAIALAVGTIPEGLPAAVTISLAIGVSRMARRQAIVRKLPAVETLGSTTVICTDKTGTLTKNQMTVQEIYAGGNLFAVTGTGYEAEGELRHNSASVNIADHPALAECLRAGVLCNEASLGHQDGRRKVHGDPTEGALLISGEKGGLLHAVTQRASPRIDMIPFESEHMFRATLHDSQGGRVIYKVGAVERLLERCTDALDPRGEVGSLDKQVVQALVDQMASRGLRVIAFARRRVDGKHSKLEHHHVASGMTFLGLQGMIDPPRNEVIVAIRQCQQAGIAVKMITGDHVVTARAIAEKVGLRNDPQGGPLIALSSQELAAIPDDQLPAISAKTTVFARVSPEQKLRLVRALQTRGDIVAMTGDGVNDAPALKQADIGIAMGRSGTDVAKSAAAMVLMDDNFASIEAAVEEGRGVFDNLTKFIVWIMPSNLGEALLLITAMILGLPLPALPLQLLWINLTDTVLGLPLAFEPKENDVMNRPPRDPKQPFLTFALLMRTGLISLISVAGGLGLFLWELKVEHASLEAARTAVINVIVLVQAAYLLNCRSLTHSLFKIGLFTNRWVLVGSLTMLVLQLLVTYSPWMNRLFHTAPINVESWIRIVAIVLVAFTTVEIEKWLRFGRNKEAQAVPA